MKNVIQLDADGFFAGFTTADESPLEPGVFHLPAGAVDAGNPPELTGGERAKWSGKRWLIIQPEPEPEPEPEPTVAEQLAQARAAAIEEIIADTERKRLDAVRNAVGVEFKDAKSETDISDKLAQLKAGKATR